MTPPRVARPPRPDEARPLLRLVRPAHALAAIATIATLLFVSRMFDEPNFVDHIIFENPTAYDLTIEVTDADAKGWLAVGTAGRGATKAANEVYDVGDVWVFRFGGQGQAAGELRLTRSQLVTDDWHVRSLSGSTTN